MIKVTNLQKYYGQHQAVKNISFEVLPGEILGFLGPNGAGKSTTMKMLTSYISPTSGDATIDGYSVVKDSIKTRSMIGYLPENSPTYREMKVYEVLDFVARVRGLSPTEAKRRIAELVDRTFLKNVYNQTIDTLSKGYRQRVVFAQALLCDPPVLILDEPTDGLDPNQKAVVRQLIRDMAEKKTIILSTHILEEMEAVCSRILIINQGQIVADGATSSLLEKADNFNCIKLVLHKSCDSNLETKLMSGKDIDRLDFSDDRLELMIYPKDKKPLFEKVWQIITAQGITPVSLEVVKPHMDQVFRSLTSN